MKRPFHTGDSITLSVDRHARIHSALIQAERLAAYTLATIRGRTAEAVAVEVAAKVIHNLCAKRQPPTPARP